MITDDLSRLRARRFARDPKNQRARRDWRAGLIAPFLITTALDMCRLDGPGVDAACGVAEPTVDRWEQGLVYPTWVQLCALALLTGFEPAFFSRRGRDPLAMVPTRTSMSFHRIVGDRPDWQRAPAHVVAFLPEAVMAVVGRDGAR